MSDVKPELRKCYNAVQHLIVGNPQFGPIHVYVRDKYQETTSIPTMAITDRGVIQYNPEFVNNLSHEFLPGCLAHEMLHLVLQHGQRLGYRDPMMWNMAGDMIINSALRDDNIKMPEWALFLPKEYEGVRSTEAVYDWIDAQVNKGNKMAKEHGKNANKGKVGCGCGVEKGKGQGGENSGADSGGIEDIETQAPVNWDQVAKQAQAMSRNYGKGSFGFSRLFEPVIPRVNWRAILPHVFGVAAAQHNRDTQTFAKRNRRSFNSNIILPGWKGVCPQVAVVIDVSGSMSTEWVGQIVGEVKRLLRTFKGSRAFLASHTDRLCWSGWVSETSDLKAPTQFSGGTDATEAYRAVAEAGRFDALAHFTDTYLPHWPVCPTRKQIIGVLGESKNTPPGAHVIEICK